MDSFMLNKFAGGISDYEDRGISGAFKYGQNLDVRKKRDSLSCNQGIADDLVHGETEKKMILLHRFTQVKY